MAQLDCPLLQAAFPGLFSASFCEGGRGSGLTWFPQPGRPAFRWRWEARQILGGAFLPPVQESSEVSEGEESTPEGGSTLTGHQCRKIQKFLSVKNQPQGTGAH